MTDIWFVGNTGVRNPLRIQDGLRVYAQSSLVGRIRGVPGARALMRLLSERGVLNHDQGRDATGSYGRKWRLVFNLNGFTYPCVEPGDGFEQSQLGPVDALTPFGAAFLAADTVPAVQECFLRAMSVPMKPLGGGRYFSPLRWTLAVLLKVEERTGSSAVSFLEFALCIQTSNPSFDLDEVADRLLELRRRREQAPAKKKFDGQAYEQAGKDYPRKVSNFKEYADMNLRYLRACGLFQRKGRGIALVPEQQVLARRLAALQISTAPLLERCRTLCQGPALPTDDAEVARAALSGLLRQLEERGIAYELSQFCLEDAAGLNRARHTLEQRLAQDNELRYAARQREQWAEICDYFALLEKRGGRRQYDEEVEISVPKEEASAYLEWAAWRAFLALGGLQNPPYAVRRFPVDQDLMPVNTAPGNGPDLVAEFDGFVIAIEVTLSENSRQEAMEGEPVRRHVADLMLRYDKPVYGLFLANRIDSNTAETFRHGVWYTREDERLEVQIIPLTLAQFRAVLRALFTTGRASAAELVELMKACGRFRSTCEAPAWKAAIQAQVDRLTAGA